MSTKEPRTCALCQQVRPLRDSHIIPEFLHGPLYDEKHRFKTFGISGRPESGLEQKGQRERLLCDECEQRFCVHEQWTSSLYRGALTAFGDTTRSEIAHGTSLTFTRIGHDQEPTTSAVPRMLKVEGFDYPHIKLFLLSLLWRMGVSHLPYFRGITLGSQEKRIRRMLLNDDPGPAEAFACQMRLIELDGTLLTDYQSRPRQYKDDGRRCCRFYSTGVRFDFMFSNHRADTWSVERFCVKPQSEYILWIDSLRSHPDLGDELIALGTNMKWIKVQYPMR